MSKGCILSLLEYDAQSGKGQYLWFYFEFKDKSCLRRRPEKSLAEKSKCAHESILLSRFLIPSARVLKHLVFIHS
jgi:hypothetical protein